MKTISVVALLLSSTAFAQAPPTASGLPAAALPSALQEVGFDQNLNHPLPLDTEFNDETGRKVQLREYFGHRPVVLAFVYYGCPMLCLQSLTSLASTLGTLSESLGKDFEVLSVSIDPRETPAIARVKKAHYVERSAKPSIAPNWHFLTGTDDNIRRLTKAAGFRYVWDEKVQQYAHPAGIIVATPQGMVSRYLFGIDYGPRDLRLSVLDALRKTLARRWPRHCSIATTTTPRGADTASQSYGSFDWRAPRRCFRLQRLSSSGRGESEGGAGSFMLGFPLFPDSASTIAEEVDSLYFFLVGLSVVLSLLIASLVVFFAIRFRRRHADEVGAQVHGGLLLELGWTVVPFVITMIIFLWGAKVFFKMANAPDETLNIYVVGKQWMWKVQHAAGQREINELHIPLGRRSN